MPKVTVLLPVYNGEKYLLPAMQSILSQSYTDYELLIVDDGSTDGSMAVVDGFHDQRIRILKNPKRLKLSGALNRGLDEAKGELVARMDADDIALPDRLAKQVVCMDSNPDVGVCGTWVKRFGGGTKNINKYPLESEQIRAYTLFDCPFAHPSVMLRKKFFDYNGLRFDGMYYPTEDFELWSRATDCFPCVNIPEVHLKYRVHDSSMTCSDWNEMDIQAARVTGSLLRKLGMDASEEEVHRHRNIGRGESCRSESVVALQQGHEWLQKLLSANSKKKRYEETAFLAILSLIWFRFCFHGASLGFDALHCYTSSPFLQKDKEKAQRVAMLALSVMKNRLLVRKVR